MREKAFQVEIRAAEKQEHEEGIQPGRDCQESMATVSSEEGESGRDHWVW